MVLEILKQEQGLAMSISGYGQLASTIKQYSQSHIALSEINKLCLEATAVLNKVNKYGADEANLINDLKKAGQLLWDNLLTRSVKDRLKHAVKRDLILSLDEELIGIPWELMHDGEEFLCLSFNLGRLVRSKELPNPVQYRSIGSSLRMLVLANPTNDLKSAYYEGLFIKNQFDRQTKEIKIDFKSTRIDTLYVKKYMRDYDIVHFAGHCAYDNVDRQESGWVLADGKFTAQDIMSLGESLSLPTLVFSNSCHSAKLDRDFLNDDYQEKTYSLASAFLFSGVRHYIGAIWKIEDPASSLFAKEFYLRLIKGESLGECMRRARLALIKKFGVNRLGWASYLLYGDPHFALFKKKEKLHPVKVKRRVFLPRKWLVGTGTGAAMAAVGIGAFLWLPTMNPTTYLLSAKSSFNIGEIYLFEKQYKKALECYRNGLKIDERQQNKPRLASDYNMLGELYLAMGKPDEAGKSFTRALFIAQQIDAPMELASSCYNLGLFYKQKRQKQKAREYFRQAQEIYRSIDTPSYQKIRQELSEMSNS